MQVTVRAGRQPVSRWFLRADLIGAFRTLGLSSRSGTGSPCQGVRKAPDYRGRHSRT